MNLIASTDGSGVGDNSGGRRAVCIVTGGASAWCNRWLSEICERPVPVASRKSANPNASNGKEVLMPISNKVPAGGTLFSSDDLQV